MLKYKYKHLAWLIAQDMNVKPHCHNNVVYPLLWQLDVSCHFDYELLC